MAGGYIGLGLVFALCVGLELGQQSAYLAAKPFLVGLGGLVFIAISAMAIRRCAQHGADSIGQVCFWSAVLLGFTISLMYITYFLLFPDSLSEGDATSKILNIPPVIAAVWAAGIGWYVHFQATAKSHRTNNAFNLLMQTRTNKEFVDRSELIQRYFPHGCGIVDVDTAPGRPDDRVTLKELEDQLAAAEALPSADGSYEALALLRDSIGRLKAQLALRYMLNFYEVMAVAISKNDLDETLLYECLGGVVPSLYRRAEKIAEFERTKGREATLVFTKLAPLVVDWEHRNDLELRKRADQARKPQPSAVG